jgi:predicted metal-dependent phosphotriesterase family hydrolase
MRYGGFGYGHILRTFTDNLKDYGIGDKESRQLLAANPAGLLAGDGWDTGGAFQESA